jgi:hypothetical protein
VQLAMRSSIPPSVWLAEDPRALDTALVILGEESKAIRDAS